MEKLKSIPALRFPGFKEEWSNNSLGGICSTFKSGNGITSKEIDEFGKYPVYGGNGLRGYTNSFTHDGTYILIGRQGALCGNITVTQGQSYISEHAIAVHTNDTSDNQWLAQKLKYMNLNQYSESSAQPGLAVNKLVKLKIKTPTLSEQQKIAAFLTTVDDKIQQLSKKKTLLEQYKKGLMQQIFSREIRFKDDQGNLYPDWKEKKLGDVGEIIGGGTPETHIDRYWSGNIHWFTPTELKTKYVSSSKRQITKAGLLNSSAKLLPVGTILVSTRATVGDVTIALVECCTNQGFQSIIVNRQNVNEFLYYWLILNKHQLLRKASGSTFLEINKTEISKLKIHLPSIPEQTKIATFLSAIDNKINHVNQQLKQTRQYKKGLLQQMFV